MYLGYVLSLKLVLRITRQNKHGFLNSSNHQDDLKYLPNLEA